MQLGSLLLKLRRGSISGGFLLGHTGSALGEFRLLSSLVCGLTMLACDILAPLPQLTLAGGNPRTFTRPRKSRARATSTSTTTMKTISAVDIHYLRSNA